MGSLSFRLASLRSKALLEGLTIIYKLTLYTVFEFSAEGWSRFRLSARGWLNQAKKQENRPTRKSAFQVVLWQEDA
jgi:hypothetical protein